MPATTSFSTFLSRHGHFRPEIYGWRHGWELTKYIYSLFFLQASEASTPLVGLDVKHDGKSRVKSKGQASFHTVSYQQGVAAPHDAQPQSSAAFGDFNGGLAAGDDGAGRRVAGQRGRGGRATQT